MSNQDNYFVVSVKVAFSYRQTQDKFQSVTGTDNEFTERQTPMKKPKSISISPVSLHVFMKTLKRKISEAYKV